jgi:hypothetical protein
MIHFSGPELSKIRGDSHEVKDLSILFCEFLTVRDEVLFAPSASAATPVTFTLTAGASSISTPTANVALGSEVSSTTSGTIPGAIGVVTVKDRMNG